MYSCSLSQYSRHFYMALNACSIASYIYAPMEKILDILQAITSYTAIRLASTFKNIQYNPWRKILSIKASEDKATGLPPNTKK